jgi:hypothetical protein
MGDLDVIITYLLSPMGKNGLNFRLSGHGPIKDIQWGEMDVCVHFTPLNMLYLGIDIGLD